MNYDERLEKAAERFADNVAHIIADQVHRAVALERDRIDAELAELRDEVANIAGKAGLVAHAASAGLTLSDVAVSGELAAVNERMARLTETVAALMADTPTDSRKVGNECAPQP